MYQKLFSLFIVSRILLLLALLCVAAPILAQRKAPASFIKAAHSEVIERWLAQSPRRAGLRVATEQDCHNQEGLAAQRKESRNYQPYYAVGDFNHDGREDFAIAFVNPKRRTQFTFAIFNGPFPGASTPAYVNQNSDLSMMGFSWHAGEQNFLLLGEFQSDFCVIFKPRGKTYQAQDCLEG